MNIWTFHLQSCRVAAYGFSDRNVNADISKREFDKCKKVAAPLFWNLKYFTEIRYSMKNRLNVS